MLDKAVDYFSKKWIFRFISFFSRIPDSRIPDFLVTTVNGLFLVENGLPKKLLKWRFFGITWNKEEIFLAHMMSPKILIWKGEQHIDEMKTVPFNYRTDDVHQLLWWHGSLYVVHTGWNRVEVWKDKEQILSFQWHPLETEGEQSLQHINSIWCDHSNFYIVEHNRGKLPVCIRVFNTRFIETNVHYFSDIETHHNNGLHNIYIENGILYTLSVNNFIMRNLLTGIDTVLDIRSHKDIGYLRGFAKDDKFFYIGESNVSSKEDRRKGNSSIIILDENYDIVKVIELEGSGDCHDIRLLKNDYAHNNITCPKVW